MRGSFDFLEFQFPIEAEPIWHNKVERWYQLDAASFGLCELWSKSKKVALPDVMFLASPRGCNEMDASFVKTGATSPAKFVYTLPSIRSSALLQVIDWQGPLLCLQNDSTTILSAIKEASVAIEPGQSAWILGYSFEQSHLAYRITIGEEGHFDLAKIENEGSKEDADLLRWLRRGMSQ